MSTNEIFYTSGRRVDFIGDDKVIDTVYLPRENGKSTKNNCDWCGGQTVDDARGNCAACGGARKAKKFDYESFPTLSYALAEDGQEISLFKDCFFATPTPPLDKTKNITQK